MTRAQFALAVGTDAKWIDNTRRILGREARNDASEARWLSLVHELWSGLGCSLEAAAAIAEQAVAIPKEERFFRTSSGGNQRVEVVIDLWRDWTVHLSRLARAIAMPPVERRGRPSGRRDRRSAKTRAMEYGVDISRLESGARRTVQERLERLDANAAFIAAGRASLIARRSP